MRWSWPTVLALSAVVLNAHGTRSAAGSPEEDDAVKRTRPPLERGGVLAAVPFFLGRLWYSLVTRSGAAPLVPFDRAALEHNPSITWIGHSTMLVRMDGVTFLTDPIFSERASPVSFAGPKRLVPPGVPLDQLPPLDFVTLSHDHYDHTDLPTVAALAKRGVTFVTPLGFAELLRPIGARGIELDWWQSTRIGPVTIHFVPARHFSGRGIGDGGRRLFGGFVVSGPTRRFYHPGDTGYFDGFKEIGARLGPIDLASMPIGAYLPPAIMRPVHVNPEEALQAANDVRARKVVAMHWGTFDLTDEPLDEPPKRFLANAARYGYAPEQTWVLSVGETRRW